MNKLLQAIKTYAAWIGAALLVIAFGVFEHMRKALPSRAPVSDSEAGEKLQKDLATAEIQEAKATGEAEGQEDQVKAEVSQVATEADKQKQLQDLADLVNRTRRNR